MNKTIKIKLCCLLAFVPSLVNAGREPTNKEVGGLFSLVTTVGVTIGPTVAPFALTNSVTENTSAEPTKDEKNRRFFAKNFDELKVETAKGKGELLDVFAVKMTNRWRADLFIKELRKRQFKKAFPASETAVEDGWKHVSWVVNSQIYLRTIRIDLKTPEGHCTGAKSDQSSPLRDLLRPLGETGKQGGSACISWDIKETKTLHKTLKEYSLDPNDNELDAHIYRGLQAYAKRIKSKRFMALLPYKVIRKTDE